MNEGWRDRNTKWKDIVTLDEFGDITSVKTAWAFHTGVKLYVTIFGVDEGEKTALVYQEGTPDINKPVKSAHFSWFRRAK